MTKDEIINSQAGGGMFLVIPSVVADDEALPWSAKWLYGIITWKCNEWAFCWATNRALGEKMGLSPKRVSALLSLLEKQGHVEIEIVSDEQTGQILQRNIYPIVKSARCILTKGSDPIPENEDTPPKTHGDPIPKNAEEKYKREIKNNNPLPPSHSAADPVKTVLDNYAGDDRELRQLLDDFLESRRKKRSPLQTKRQASLLVNNLEKYSGGDRACKVALLEKAILLGWKGIYPLKPGDIPAPAQPEPLRGQGVRYL